jgi:transcriptional regulator with XRE-family HTH domain
MDWLKKIRTDQQKTQRQVAQQAGISTSGYANVETGTRQPSVIMAIKIATVLKFKWTKFFIDKEK